jgi:hypothetical protein
MIPTLNSETANIISKYDLTVFDEITAISRTILTQSLGGNVSAAISTGTTMTTTTLYYEVWNNITENRKVSEQIDSIIKYFEKIGYHIIIRLNTSTSNTIIWEVNW